MIVNHTILTEQSNLKNITVNPELIGLQVAFEEEAVRVQPVDLDSAFSTSDESQSALIKEASANLVRHSQNRSAVMRERILPRAGLTIRQTRQVA